MPKLSKSLPKYRRHSLRNVGFVVVHGKRRYLPGRFNSDESKRAYRRVLLELRPLDEIDSSNTQSIGELAAAYLIWADEYYSESNEPECIALALQTLIDLYEDGEIAEFGPKALKAVREKMIGDGLCRTGINKRVGKIKRMFKWGVSEEIVPAKIYQALQAVEGLKKGRTTARESKKVTKVADAHVDAVKAFVSPQIWALIELQRYTGARSGELVKLRTCDVDTSKPVWRYSVEKHKTTHRGQSRTIYFGPKAIKILKPWLRKKSGEYLFQPKEAMEWRFKQRAEKRKVPTSCGNRPGTNRVANPKKKPGEIYTVRAYHQAVRKACLAAKIPHWHPHQLRHTAGTFLRKEFGIEVAKSVLGHQSMDATEIYAERDTERPFRLWEWLDRIY